jgi:NAD(P)-dependent dehydrogenase (short-subunit alcohol dehydrogenase family)
MSLEGRVAVVTGGAGGIGRATAELLADAGAEVAVVDIVDPAETVGSLEEMGRRAIGYSCDVTEESQVTDLFQRVGRDFGHLDIVHNNAGIAHCKPCEDMTFAEWRRVVSIDLDAVFLASREAGRYLIAQGTGGSIINTASMSGSIVNYPQEQVAYNAAKAGVIHLTKSLACEWAKHGIRVNAVSPGYIATNMTPGSSPQSWVDAWFAMSPTKRLGTPLEVASAVLYLASDLATFTTGANLVVDGGYSCY